MNLQEEPEESRLCINAWVEEATRGRIEDLLPPDSIDDSTVVVMLNAINLFADWKMPFNMDQTRQQAFIKSD